MQRFGLAEFGLRGLNFCLAGLGLKELDFWLVEFCLGGNAVYEWNNCFAKQEEGLLWKF